MAWSGAGVTGPGVSTFYFDEAASGWTAALGVWANAIKLKIPSSVTLTTSSSGDLIQDTTGDIVGTWFDGTPGVIPMTGAATHAQGVGGRVVWDTNDRTNNRRVRGTTYLVPLCASVYDTDGTITTSDLGVLQSACGTLVASMGGAMRVWTRPRPGVAGKSAVVASAVVQDKVSWLRSRRS